MSKTNHIYLVGNLTADPVLKELTTRSSGEVFHVCEFSIAQSYRMQNGEQSPTEYFDVRAYRQLGQNVAASLSKGTRVAVTGVLKQQKWQNAEGQNRSRHIIVADEVTPSLRWAETVVTKNPREEASDEAAPAMAGPVEGETEFSSDPF